jgi:replicative DNA helicase
MNAQLPPIGANPDVAELLLGALMYSSPEEALAVLTYVRDDDVDWPLSPILAAVRRLAGSTVPPSPQLVSDELRRGGKLDRRIAFALASATTSGVCAMAAGAYASALVAESLRRRAESAGAALTSAADDAAEADLVPLVARAAESIIDCANRLAALRGEPL